ncbi:hypothetical protein T492DRAFT_146592 [Pavlovales sp. CCMP2436]|nr:hypothetical protein T492DRAFT_146592 [Pavlovales sp. CCMP2436]
MAASNPTCSQKLAPLLVGTFPPGFRLLHVEDDALLRKSFEYRVLKKLKVPFDIAENGADAVRMIVEEKRDYSIVLMDNQMPIMSGEQATRALRVAGFAGVIIGMTGDPAGCAERDAFEAAGLTSCVDKVRCRVGRGAPWPDSTVGGRGGGSHSCVDKVLFSLSLFELHKHIFSRGNKDFV